MKVSWKKYFLVICKILGLFFNPSTSDDKYSLCNGINLLQHFQMELSKKENIFSPFLFLFWKFTFNFEHFQKKLTLIADEIFNLRTPKNDVR